MSGATRGCSCDRAARLHPACDACTTRQVLAIRAAHHRSTLVGIRRLRLWHCCHLPVSTEFHQSGGDCLLRSRCFTCIGKRRRLCHRLDTPTHRSALTPSGLSRHWVPVARNRACVGCWANALHRHPVAIEVARPLLTVSLAGARQWNHRPLFVGEHLAMLVGELHPCTVPVEAVVGERSGVGSRVRRRLPAAVQCRRRSVCET